MSYQYPGQAFVHSLTALKGWYRESSLDAEVTLSSNVNIGSLNLPPSAGLVVHPVSIVAAITPYTGPVNGPGTFTCEMGCGINGVTNNPETPLYLWSGPQDPDVSNPGVIPGIPAGGSVGNPPDFVSVLPLVTGSNMVALVATGGYEVESTEFDQAQTYVTGQFLRAVNSNTDTNAGRVTNQRNSGSGSPGYTTSGLVQTGDPTLTAWDTVVGIVSRGTYTNALLRPVVSYWTYYLPGTR